MSNEVLFVVTMILNYVGMLMFYRFFNKKGLFAWIAFATIVANIEVLKSVTLFGIPATLGNSMFATIFMVQHILEQHYSKKEAYKGVALSFAVITALTIFMNIDLAYIANEFDFAQDSLATIFGFIPRIAISSISAFLIASLVNIFVFRKVKALTKGKHVWIAEDVSVYLSQVVDNSVFVLGAFLFVYPLDIVLSIILSTTLIEFVLAFLDTPIFYIAGLIKKRFDTLGQQE